MTSTLPWRRMILHLSHIFLTEGRTFIISSFRLMVLVRYIYTQPLVFVCEAMHSVFRSTFSLPAKDVLHPLCPMQKRLKAQKHTISA